ncbi:MULTISPECIES: hypothetical protein [Nonomuraea]|uniref:DUF2147 domain-containing protein n=2 Tax=Nonomuraea TaxID=83681 RepID=A0ABW1C199_9ACTN|nr:MULTISPECIES: hypothetical protein [Nonomuraea]MDA0641769.1 hypothetical protein [Nonomuraea ferruginea]TXK40837.1 hypothetical protein FR742_15695 [Nonomuraea sp. C10]
MKRLLIPLLMVTVLVASACKWDESYVLVGGKRVGEWTLRYGDPQSYDITLYRNGSGRYLGVSSIILGHYKNLRARGRSVESAARKTLSDILRPACRDIRNQAIRAKCNEATGGGRWSDFRGALVDIDHNRGGCLTISIRGRTTPNWTWRPRTDRHCRPG